MDSGDPGDQIARLDKRLNVALCYIEAFQIRNGFAPSLQDVANYLSEPHKTTAARAVNKLCRLGFLRKTLKHGRLFYSINRRADGDE